jgi:hypothetical protein
MEVSMDWLRELHPFVFWWSWMMVAILAGGALYATWWAQRNVKALAAQEPVDVSRLSEGYRLVWGRTSGPALTSPLTGRACVWWKAEVWESARELDPHGKSRYVWRQVADEESDRPIVFGDGKTTAAVWTFGATILSSAWSDWKGRNLPPENVAPDSNSLGAPPRISPRDSQGSFGPRYRYIEKIIPPDSPIFALGEVTRTDQSLYKEDADDDELADPAAQAGAHDDDIWRPEPSRLGIAPTTDKQIAQDMSQAVWTISRAGKSPFLLSLEHPEAVSAEQELGAKGGMIMGAIFTGLAAVLLWIRLSG